MPESMEGILDGVPVPPVRQDVVMEQLLEAVVDAPDEHIAWCRSVSSWKTIAGGLLLWWARVHEGMDVLAWWVSGHCYVVRSGWP